jgi:hypothetical protein
VLATAKKFVETILEPFPFRLGTFRQNGPSGEEKILKSMVGMRGFEPPTPTSRTCLINKCNQNNCLGFFGKWKRNQQTGKA